jgi:alpha-N-arabinofuranosidase
MNFTPGNENEKAGLLIFQSENYYYFLCSTVDKGKPVVQLLKGKGNNKNSTQTEILASEIITGKKGSLFFKIAADGDSYSFYYASKKDKWQLLKANVDGKFLSTKIAGGFVGSMYAMYATSEGKASSAKAYYNWFECKSNDGVYK